MMKMNIDMARKDSYSEPMKMSEPSYPSFHYDGKEEVDLPKEGEMVIRFRKVSESESDSDQGGKHYCCTIEVREIVSVKESAAAPASNRGKETEDALDRLKAEAESEDEED